MDKSLSLEEENFSIKKMKMSLDLLPEAGEEEEDEDGHNNVFLPQLFLNLLSAQQQKAN